jgi:hypothetical protein
MKIYLKNLLFLIIILILSCEKDVTEVKGGYLITIEDHSNGYIYPSGFYYRYVVSDYKNEVNPLDEFELLKINNIIVIEGWYRASLNGCSSPGSDWVTETAYPNVLIIRLEKKADEILKYKFAELESPQPIPCGYVVQRYQLLI